MSTAPLFGRFFRLSGAAALCFCLAVPAPVLAAPASEDETAKELYQRASAKYSAADYESAIELFTAALERATSNDLSYRVRGALLFNLAKSHVKAYEEITRDIKNLRSARAIYRRYLDEADEAGGDYGDTVEAKSELERVERMLEEEEKKAADKAAVVGSGSDADALRAEAELQAVLLERYLSQASRHKTTGVALSVVGGISFAGGIGLIAWGSTFKRFAIDEIENDRDADQAGEPYTTGEQDYLDGEIQKGKIWMGAGAGVAVVGAAGIGLGVWQLMKAKKANADAEAVKSGKKRPEAMITPVFTRDFSGLSLTGRF